MGINDIIRSIEELDSKKDRCLAYAKAINTLKFAKTTIGFVKCEDEETNKINSVMTNSFLTKIDDLIKILDERLDFTINKTN